MFLKKWLKKSLKGGIVRFLPMALLASVVDAAVLWGIRSFIDIVNGSTKIPLVWWLVGMLTLAALRLCFLYWKSKISENWLYRVSARVNGWFLHRLRSLSSRVFHTSEGDRKVEAAYEATLVLQMNGGVFFQAVQAVLQLFVFLPVLFYISWPLALFLFVVVVPFVAVLQRKLHKLGPAEESLLRDRSDYRGDLSLARRLFRQWSGRNERAGTSRDLLKDIRGLRDDGLYAAVKKSGLSLVTETVSVLAMVLVLGFCALLMSRGYMEASGLVLFSSAVLLCYKPVKECTRVLPQFRAAMSALNVLEDFEKLPTNVPLGKKGPCSVAGVAVTGGRFGYDGASSLVFENLSLEWSREKPVLVRGRNGIGKSTLLRLLAGLEHFDAGEVQFPHDVFFVAQDLELPPRRMLVQLLESARRTSTEETLTAFIQFSDVSRLLHKETLSGGERARVALLWALASDCKTVLLDEPFASVALADRENLLKSFLNAAKSLDKWTIVVSHDVLSPELECIFNVVHL